MTGWPTSEPLSAASYGRLTHHPADWLGVSGLLTDSPRLPMVERMSGPIDHLLGELERQRLHALVQADLRAADALHADDYELISPGGNVLSRSDYLGGIASGELTYHVFEAASNVRVRSSTGMGVVRYKARIDIEWSGGHDAGLFWHTDVYEQRDGLWQAVWSQATRTQLARTSLESRARSPRTRTSVRGISECGQTAARVADPAQREGRPRYLRWIVCLVTPMSDADLRPAEAGVPGPANRYLLTERQLALCPGDRGELSHHSTVVIGAHGRPHTVSMC